MTPITSTKLPESITSLFDTKNKKCRVEWRSTATGEESQGEWFPLCDEAALQAYISNCNRQYRGAMTFWIGYK